MTYFADQAKNLRVAILANDQLAKDTYRVRLDAAELASSAVPGQFFMLRIAGCNDPLIGRALALFGCDGGLELVYLVKGKFTKRLVQLQPGDFVEVTGPLGNGFSNVPVDHLIMVAGGIGQTPFLALAREALGRSSYGQPPRAAGYARRVSFCYGVRSADYLAALELFDAAGVQVHIATRMVRSVRHSESQVRWRKLLLEETGQTTRVAVCGPEPMMEAVSKLALKYEVPCEVSLETPMACGIGICFTCVAKIGSSEDWDYKRTCVEGPIFNAEQIVW